MNKYSRFVICSDTESENELLTNLEDITHTISVDATVNEGFQ